MTRFERAVIIGVRALQLSIGAPPLIDITKLERKEPLLIAKEELERGLLPITVKRRTQSGREALIPLECLIKKEKEVFGNVPRLA